MKEVVKADRITGKVTVEYSGKGLRDQEVEQGRLASPIANRTLELLTWDNPWRVEVVKATCVGTYEAFLGYPFSTKSKCGNVVDFLVVLGAIPEGKLKVTIRWKEWKETISTLHVIAIEHSYGNPYATCSATMIGISIEAASFEEKIQKVAMGMVEAVTEAVAQLKFPLMAKTEKVSRAYQEMRALAENLKEAEAVV